MNQDLKQSTDGELLQLSRSGDVAAFGELVRRYESKVAATVRGMLGNNEGADDIAQETFIRFYNALDRFREEAAVGTYVTRIAINLSLNELRRRKRRRILFKPLDPGDDVEEPSAAGDFEHFDKKEIVQYALEKLDPKFRAVVTLRLIEGYTTEETASILGVPVGTVLSRLLRAQKKLRTILNTYMEGS
ncbi:MAG TPA: sigma-70 family RNA polymerase sigma factor [Bacteroidota bacterium]|nr:sigma-70 family RNA polymerase sigma factor [Bacteroidota bacterium]